MRLVSNTGADRVVDLMREAGSSASALDIASPELSLFAVHELSRELAAIGAVRLLLPHRSNDLGFWGDEADRHLRNRLQLPWLARQTAEWLQSRVELRQAGRNLLQGAFVFRDADAAPQLSIHGSVGLSTSGLGMAPGRQLEFVQTSETAADTALPATWFEQQWGQHKADPAARDELLARLRELSARRDPTSIYAAMLLHLFSTESGDFDEERIIKSATGIRESAVWKKLFKFQRDGVIGAIDKLERFGGCIVADSVGLGKTFEALAVIRYYELRNDRVLVLCPKRLRENWTLYKANDRRNPLASDQLRFDVLNHTDLSRDAGMSGDIDLANLNWGNYDLVVIDESHNFRNKRTPRQGSENRYDRLMRRIIREGVRTRVLMLSATPVNNRLADLKNQIAFATEGNDAALAEHGIASIDSTTRLAQRSFSRWLELPEEERTPARLVDMLGFDYFSLLDHLTIARSRRHIAKYYGTDETGRFPDRARPRNIYADIDRAGEFRPIADINTEIRRLTLASYAPLRYVHANRREAYDRKYSTRVRDSRSIFRQVDREESLVALMRVNMLKRLESAVSSFALTLERQLRDVERTLARIDERDGDDAEFEELNIDDIDIDDPRFEPLLVGSKIKVLLGDVDLVRWRQDLETDRNRLDTLLSAARQVDAARDAKLHELKALIADKVRNPTNPGNRKLIVFTAFADTAHYLYEHIAGWARDELGVHSALVTGAGSNRCTLALRRDMPTLLAAFSPRSKERPADYADEGELDLLIATDCISEGQNLQDCDWLVNYDIHWNPVRIIQRFGRIDRIGSANASIQLVNFWPNMELEEYIGLEQRVSGRMVLLDVSATGEENVIDQDATDPMNDLEYRRRQLLRLQETVIDLEDLSSGVSITDLTLTDFRLDLARHLKAHPGKLEALPPGAMAVTTTLDADLPPGVIFCLRAEGEGALRLDPGYPLAPHFLVHVGEDDGVLLPYTQAKHVLDRLKRLSIGRELPDAGACARFERATQQGADMTRATRALAAAVASIVGKGAERAAASLFSPGGTHALRGEFAGQDDFEVVAFLVVLPTEGA